MCVHVTLDAVGAGALIHFNMATFVQGVCVNLDNADASGGVL